MGEWIAIDENEVGPLAGFDGTRIMIEMHGAGGNDGGGLYGFEWRESSLDIEFEFAQQAIAGQAGITAWHDGDAGFVQGADHSKGLGRAIFHLLGRGVAAHGAKFDVEHKGRIGDAGRRRCGARARKRWPFAPPLSLRRWASCVARLCYASY